MTLPDAISRAFRYANYQLVLFGGLALGLSVLDAVHPLGRELVPVELYDVAFQLDPRRT